MNIRVHKQVNSNHVTLGKESLMNTFYGLIELYNKQITYKDLEITKQQLWELAGYGGEYNSKYISELIQELVKSKPFDISSLNKLGITSIGGSMFVVTTYDDGRLLVEVPRSYQRLLFYKKDIDLMTKAKKKLKMSVEELEHWDNETKEKSKFLVLLKKADMLKIQGKYNKRLYALLMQWSYTGSYEVKYKDFKEILEIPESYKASAIDIRVLNPAKKELLKYGIKINEIKKIKEGRSISKIKIFFEAPKEEKTVKKPKKSTTHDTDKKQPVKRSKTYTEEEIQRAIKKCAKTEDINESFLLEMRKRSENIFMTTLEKYIKQGV